MDANITKGTGARRPRIRGITRAAMAMGISREHLRMVMHGKKTRNSEKLKARFLAIQGAIEKSPEVMSKEEFEAKTAAKLNEMNADLDRLRAAIDLTKESMQRISDSVKDDSYYRVACSRG